MTSSYSEQFRQQCVDAVIVLGNDLCGFSIVLNDQFSVSLENEMRSYMGTHDWEAYLKEIMAKIELRIPDKFLKAKGWL